MKIRCIVKIVPNKKCWKAHVWNAKKMCSCYWWPWRCDNVLIVLKFWLIYCFTDVALSTYQSICNTYSWSIFHSHKKIYLQFHIVHLFSSIIIIILECSQMKKLLPGIEKEQIFILLLKHKFLLIFSDIICWNTLLIFFSWKQLL